MNLSRLFDGLSRAYGTYQVTDSNGKKLSGNGLTKQEPLTKDIWELHLSGERSLGVIPIRDDNSLAFAAIDVDIYPLDIEALELRIRELELPLCVCRSKSGGAHLYLFVDKPGVAASLARMRMAEWAAELGYAGVEIFPKQDELRNKDDVGNWINMPYYGGDDDKLRYGYHEGRRLSMEEFVDVAISKMVQPKDLEDFQVMAVENDLLEGGPPCLQTLLRNGFPEGGRNISLFNLGVLARKKYGDDWGDKIDEMNEELLSTPLTAGEVAQIKRNLGKKSYFYKCNDSPINSVCQRSICMKRRYGIGGEASELPSDFKPEGSIRILTEEVYYITTVNGKRVSLNAQAMCSMHAFRVSVMSQTGYMVPMLKPRQFATIIQEITTNAQEVEAPQHSGRKGALMQEVLQIASGSNLAENWAQCLSGLPLRDDKGGVFLHPHQLVKILKRRLSLRSLEPQQLFEALNGEGVTIKEKKIGGRVFWHITELDSYEVLTEEESL